MYADAEVMRGYTARGHLQICLDPRGYLDGYSSQPTARVVRTLMVGDPGGVRQIMFTILKQGRLAGSPRRGFFHGDRYDPRR